MDKTTRTYLYRGVTRIDAPYWISIILLFLGMSILDRPGTAIIPLMVQFGFPVNEYALLIMACGIFAITARKQAISALLPLVMIPYIWYTYWYYHLQPSAPINYTLVTSFLYFSLMVFMCRAQAIFYLRTAPEELETYLQNTAYRLSRLPADVMIGAVMIILGALIHAQPQGGVVDYAAMIGVPMRLFGWWLIIFGFLRLRKYTSAWDVWLVLPLLLYCVLTFVYIANQEVGVRNPILGILYVSLFLFTLRANLSGRG